jgi:hypothetical protein
VADGPAAQPPHHEDERLFPVIRRNNPGAAALRTVLDLHLVHEERDLAPLVPESVTEAEWREFEKSNTAGKKPTVLAMQGHWMIDNLSPAGVEVVTSVVPAVPRFIMLRLLGGPYRRRREACWGGTPAASVPATPLTF